MISNLKLKSKPASVVNTLWNRVVFGVFSVILSHIRCGWETAPTKSEKIVRSGNRTYQIRENRAIRKPHLPNQRKSCDQETAPTKSEKIVRSGNRTYQIRENRAIRKPHLPNQRYCGLMFTNPFHIYIANTDNPVLFSPILFSQGSHNNSGWCHLM